MSKRKEILKDAGIYTFSSYIAQALDFATGILIRYFLGPTNMGIWAFLQVIQNYAKHSGLGVTTATARDVPYYLGKGEPEKAQEIQNLVFTFSFFTTLLTAGAVFCWTLIHWEKYSPSISMGLLVISGLIILQRLYNLFVVVIRSYKQFVFAGWLNIISSAITLCLSVALSWKFQLYGYYAATLLTFVILLAIVYFRTPHRFRFDFRWAPLLPLLNLGVAIVFSDILRSVLMSIDRIVIAKFLGFEALGHYSVALMAGNYLYSLPNMLNVIFFPHFQEAFAKRDSLSDLEKYLNIPALCTAYLFPFFIGLIWTSAEWLIPLVLPQYVEGIPALRYFILGSYFLAMTHPFNTFLITAKQHWILIPAQGIAIAVGFFLSWLVIYRGGGIEAVAAVSSATYAILFFILSLLALQKLPFTNAFKFFPKVCAPFLWMTLLLFGSDRLTTPNAFITFLFRYSVFILMMLPCVVFVEKETKLISTACALCGIDFRQRPFAFLSRKKDG